VRLWLLGYLAIPVDLVPDFVPVLGYADDAIIVAWALRSVVRRASPDALQWHLVGESRRAGRGPAAVQGLGSDQPHE
jgi:uncharacterized membrane protein YkvA (DUF1232 family)